MVNPAAVAEQAQYQRQVEAVAQEPEPELSQETVAQLTHEALAPEASQDFLDIDTAASGIVRLQFRFMPLAKEEEVASLLTPFLPRLESLNAVGVADIMKLVQDGVGAVMDAVLIIARNSKHDWDQEWVRANLSSVHLVQIIEGQLRKYGQQEALGKLLRLFVRR